MIKCTKCHDKEGYLALYELKENGTKVWRTDLCDSCEEEIFKNNTEIRKQHPNMKFKEVL